MSLDSGSPMPEPDLSRSHDDGTCLIKVKESTREDRAICTTYTYRTEPRTPSFTFEHDLRKRLFIVTSSDGEIERFRDNPTRHLIVEPDPETGEMRPVIKRGKPSYLYLCREERENH